MIPTDTINIYIDKDAVLRSGMMLPEAIRHLKGEELRDAIPDKLSISLKNIRLLTKVDLLMLEILANCNWERPLYMAISVGNSSKLKFDDYFVQEGLAFRFTPFNYKARRLSSSISNGSSDAIVIKPGNSPSSMPAR